MKAIRTMPSISPALVSVARGREHGYGILAQPVPAPELPRRAVVNVAQAAVRDLFLTWGLDAARAGSEAWNPLGELIPAGSRVVLKPNWVLHYNQSGESLDCLITHTTVIEAILDYVFLTKPSHVVLGDAPLQGCNFAAMCEAAGVDPMVERFHREGLPLTVTDFRRTHLLGRRLGEARKEDCRSMDQFVLFDLAGESLLEDLREDADKFRVTMYNPDLLRRTHAPGRHQYLIARELIEADVVINLPKLKTHMKAGVTGALKNLIGINGNKEYLPHHRKGGSGTGGDCYAGSSPLKRVAEDMYDAANRLPSGQRQHWIARVAETLVRGGRPFGDDLNMEGAWHGNDTIWRTCLDLQRILRYGDLDANLHHTPQRTVVSITDALMGGEGEGPLRSLPVPSGFLTGSVNPAAAEWVNTRLMGFDPAKIALVRHSLDRFTYPLADFGPSDIRARWGGQERAIDALFPFDSRSFLPPKGWQGHCELPHPALSHGDESHQRPLVA